MTPPRQPHDPNADEETAGSRIRATVRSGIRRVPPLDRAVARRSLERARTERLERLYRRLRNRYLPEGASVSPLAEIDQVEAAVIGNAPYSAFFRIACYDGNFDRAAVTVVRELLQERAYVRARSFAQTLQTMSDLREIGDLCLALVAIQDPMPQTAWTLFQRIDIGFVLRLAPVEYFRLAFGVDPDTASDVLRRMLDGEWPVAPVPGSLIEIARSAMAVRHYALCDATLSRAERRIERIADRDRATRLQHDVDWLRSWLTREELAVEPVAVRDHEIPIAVLDYKQPDQIAASVNLGDPVQTLASLGHLVRRRDLTFTGDPELVAVTDTLRGRVKPERIIESPPATVHLYRVDRDATSFAPVPEGTWMLAFGWYMHMIFGMRYDFPFNPRIRPIFISFHLNSTRILTAEAIQYLRAHGPVGCRDWTTVEVLQAAGVPAFFSGCVTTTIDTVFPPDPSARPHGTLFVDSPKDERGDVFGTEAAEAAEQAADQAAADAGPVAELEQGNQAVLTRGLRRNLIDALERVATFRDNYKRVVTSRLHCYLPTRAIGGTVEFKPKNPADPRLDGLAFITDDEFERMRTGILDKLATVLGAITAGESAEDVYRLWSEICAPDVAAAEARRAEVTPLPPTTFDVAAACKVVHEASVTVERSEPGPEGPEIDVEFSLDGNLKNQMGVVLESIVSRASRPIRLFVLCRGHGQADFDLMARRFPTVSFVWLPTDHIDYGRILGMIRHITVATMDRLLLPDLLPDVDRIIHHDLDALCLTDLAELADLDIGDKPLAARDQPHPNGGSGYRAMLRAGLRLRDEDGLAREFIHRITVRHGFDFVAFNAGIMVLNLARMRADEFSRNFLPYAERFGLNDQELLNAYAGAEHVQLDRSWNAFPRLEVMDDPKILHWLGPLKPWSRPYVAGRETWRAAEAGYKARVKGIA